jgi:hypothetical protein
MATFNSIMRWLVRLSLALCLLILVYVLYEGIVLGGFRSGGAIATPLLTACVWIIPALALGTWSNAATGRQSILFYFLALISLGPIAFFVLFGMWAALLGSQ